MKKLIIFISLILSTISIYSQGNKLDSLKSEKQKVMFMNGFKSGDVITNNSVKSKLDELDRLIELEINKSKSTGELDFESDSSSEVFEVTEDQINKDIYTYKGYYPIHIWRAAAGEHLSKIKDPKLRKLCETAMNNSLNGLKVYDTRNKSYVYLSNSSISYYDEQLTKRTNFRVNIEDAISVDHVKYLKDKYLSKEVIMANTANRVYIEDIDTLTYHKISAVKIGKDKEIWLVSDDGFKVDMFRIPEFNNPFNLNKDRSYPYTENSKFDCVVFKEETPQVVYRSKAQEKKDYEMLAQLIKEACNPDSWSLINDIQGALYENSGLSKKIGKHYISQGMSLVGFKNSFPTARLISSTIEFGMSASVYKLNNHILKFVNGKCISIE